jgi:hypothetical protein
MNDDFANRVRSAAVAGWWTLLIGALFLLVQWLVYLAVMRSRPAWMLAFWGDGMEWTTIQTVWVWIAGVFKMCLWLAALAVVWLSLWARRLRQG